jgi:hypothetical protein
MNVNSIFSSFLGERPVQEMDGAWALVEGTRKGVFQTQVLGKGKNTGCEKGRKQ